MTSLSEAYNRGEWNGRDPRRVSAGGALFALGALAVVAAILVVTTELTAAFGAETVTDARRLAGALAGVGIPAMFLGVVAVIPSSRRERLGVVTGALVSLAGVWLFWQVYPDQWVGDPNSLAFPTAMVYFVGGSVALWFVLSAIASFTLRNNPQGMVRIEVTRRGETKEIRVSRDQYRRYKDAIEGDGNAEAVARDLQSRFEG